MNVYEKEKIEYLLNEGLGYKKIADTLGLPVNTVKSYCYRHQGKSKKIIHLCNQCGDEVEQNPGRKKKLFCSDTCRMKWWNAHPEKANREAHKYICIYCGKEFNSYIKRQRKFCSRDCYAKFRMKEELI